MSAIDDYQADLRTKIDTGTPTDQPESTPESDVEEAPKKKSQLPVIVGGLALLGAAAFFIVPDIMRLVGGHQPPKTAAVITPPPVRASAPQPIIPAEPVAPKQEERPLEPSAQPLVQQALAPAEPVIPPPQPLPAASPVAKPERATPVMPAPTMAAPKEVQKPRPPAPPTERRRQSDSAMAGGAPKPVARKVQEASPLQTAPIAVEPPPSSPAVPIKRNDYAFYAARDGRGWVRNNKTGEIEMVSSGSVLADGSRVLAVRDDAGVVATTSGEIH